MLAGVDPLTLSAALGAAATITAAYLAYRGVRRAAPAITAEATELEPRLTDVERQQLGWTRLLDYYEDHDRQLREQIVTETTARLGAELRAATAEARVGALELELAAARHPPGPAALAGE